MASLESAPVRLMFEASNAASPEDCDAAYVDDILVTRATVPSTAETPPPDDSSQDSCATRTLLTKATPHFPSAATVHATSGSGDVFASKFAGVPENKGWDGLGGSAIVTYDLAQDGLALVDGVGVDFNIYEPDPSGRVEVEYVTVAISEDGATFLTVDDTMLAGCLGVDIAGDEQHTDKNYRYGYDISGTCNGSVRLT